MDAIVAWLTSLIPQLAPPTALLIVQVVYAAILSFAAPIILVVGLTWMERKVAARIQNRIGPNRAGPFGWFQGFADAIKMFTKEDITPAGADRIVYNLAPALRKYTAPNSGDVEVDTVGNPLISADWIGE